MLFFTLVVHAMWIKKVLDWIRLNRGFYNKALALGGIDISFL